MAGLEGWWPAAAAAACGSLIACGVVVPVATALLSNALILLALAVPAFGTGQAIQTSPLLVGYRLLPLAALALLAIALSEVLRVAATRIDRSEQEALDRLAATASAEQEPLRTEEIRRIWHDTALNTLESVARGVPPASWAVLQQRCEDDLSRLSRYTSGGPLLDRLRQAARNNGLTVEVETVVDGQPPLAVAEAFVSAGAEALRNVAKHAESDLVEVSGRIGEDLAWIDISDGGRGFAHARRGIGTRYSVEAVMTQVGGVAQISSIPGVGTRVSLVWDQGQARAFQVLADVRRGLLMLLTALIVISLVVWLWLTGLDSGLVDRPVRVAALLLAAIVCAMALVAVVLPGARRWSLWVVILTGALCVSLALPISDPYCASFQVASPLDPRLLILICVAVAFWRASFPLAVALAVLAASSAAVYVTAALVPECGTDYLFTCLVALCLAASGFQFSRALERQRVRVSKGAYLQHLDLIHASRQRATAASLTWSVPQTETALGLMGAIAAGEPDSAQLRDQARRCAAGLRSQVLLLGVAGPLPDALRRLASSETVVLTLDGDPADVGPGSAEDADLLEAWLPETGAVGITLAELGGEASLLAHTQDAGRAVPGSWTDESERWLHLQWQLDQAQPRSEREMT